MKLQNIILYVLIILPCPAFAASNSFAPPSGKTLLFIGQDRDTISHYVGATGNVPSGTMFYTSIQEMKGLEEENEYGSGPQDGRDLLLYYPNSVIQVGLYMVGGLDNIILGIYDANLTALAQWIKKADRPVYLRIGYEFDNPQNHYDPDDYKEAFRYVVDFLRKAGVHNAAYVWHSYTVDNTVGHWMDWYPGDDYVDWFGASLFSTYQISPVTSFLKLAREHHKPLMIAESTPSGLYTARARLDWLNHVFHFIEEQNVEAFCYINSNWDVMPMYLGQHWGDARIEKDPEIKNLWLHEINQDRYLKSSPDLFRSLGWTDS